MKQKEDWSLKQKLENYCPNVIILAEAGNGVEDLLQLKSIPQLIFLDIEMPK